jgi:hypothetical protein
MIVRRSARPLETVDGRLDKAFWEQTNFCDDFHDIEGDRLLGPLKKTEIKLLWDDVCLYIGVRLTENEIWANVTDSNLPSYLDNDMEFFFTQDPGLQPYFELEMNARNVLWDLFLSTAYRDCGRPTSQALFSWDMPGVRSAVHIDGKLNDPSADNRFWSVEVVIPWFTLSTFPPDERYPDRYAPKPGDIWRANFSRVEHRVDVRENQYHKRMDPATGKPFPEYNWVWAPTGVIDIHIPEMWGFLLFSDDPRAAFIFPPDACSQMRLFRLYYAMRAYGAAYGRYTSAFAELAEFAERTDAEGLRTLRIAGRPGEWPPSPELYVTPNLFEITSREETGTWHIRQDGYIWKTC